MRHLSEAHKRFQAELRPLAQRMGPSSEQLKIALDRYGVAENAIIGKAQISEETAQAYLAAVNELHAAALFQTKIWTHYESTLATFKLIAVDAVGRDKKL